jgi:hypothetical protein
MAIDECCDMSTNLYLKTTAGGFAPANLGCKGIHRSREIKIPRNISELYGYWNRLVFTLE